MYGATNVHLVALADQICALHALSGEESQLSFDNLLGLYSMNFPGKVYLEKIICSSRVRLHHFVVACFVCMLPLGPDIAVTECC